MCVAWRKQEMEVSDVGHPQFPFFIGIFHESWGSSMTMERPIYKTKHQRKKYVAVPPKNHIQTIICVNLATLAASLDMFNGALMLHFLFIDARMMVIKSNQQWWSTAGKKTLFMNNIDMYSIYLYCSLFIIETSISGICNSNHVELGMIH